MTFCYVVMCHTDPQAVLRLVRRIRELSPTADVLVRHDRPGLFEPGEVEAAGADVLRSDIAVQWGDITLAEATIEAFLVARKRTGCSHAVLISGQDYPIRNLADWEAEIVASGVDALLDPLAAQPQDHSWRWRIFSPPAPLRADGALLRRALVRAGSLLSTRSIVLTKPGELRLWWGTRRLRPSPPITPVKASAWIVLGERALASIERQTADRPELEAFFREVRTPDEWFASSLVCADPELRVGIGSTTAKYFPPGAPNPVWIDLEVLARLRRSSDAPFVRKVAADAGPAVYAEADRMAARSPDEVRADIVEPHHRDVPWAESVAAHIVLPDVGTDPA